jgi:hypothetical protein
LGRAPPAGVADAGATGASLSDQVMSSALKYKLQAPLVDTLLQSAGLQSADAAQPVKNALKGQ